MFIVVVVLVIGCGAPAGSSSPPSASPGEATFGPAPASPVGTPPSTMAPSATPRPASWVSAAPMHKARQGFDAVLLGDGTLLAVGDDFACHPGGAAPGSETAELYDPVADTWVEVPSLNNPRKVPATVGLGDGSAMVIGGVNQADIGFSSTKVFSPATRTWSDGPLLGVARGMPLAAVLKDGRVLVVSEGRTEGNRTTSEIYDPAAGTWTNAGAWRAGTSIMGLVSLRDGHALALGIDSNDTEPTSVTLLFDPSSGDWSGIDPPPDASNAALIALADGGAMLIGGAAFLGFDEDVDAGRRVHRFDPGSARWAPASPMTTARFDPQVVVLADGRVLVAGGGTTIHDTQGAMVSSTEIYEPSTDRWTFGPDIREPRKEGLAVLLGDGSVLLLGGNAKFNTEGDTPFCAPPLQTVERFDPGS